MVDFAAIAAKAAAEGADQTVAKVGGEFKPLAAGPCRLRFMGYIEAGKHTGSYQGKPKTNNIVYLIFEVSGPRHPPREFDGVKFPNIIVHKENLSDSDKSNFYKLMTRMNYAGNAKHMGQLLGNAYKGEVFHREWKGADGKPRIEAELKHKDTGYSIAPPRTEDPETGEMIPLNVAEPLSPVRCFIWNYADKEQWASIFIDGMWEARKDKDGNEVAPAKSKNIYQAAIKKAINFDGSPVHQMLLENGMSLDVPDVDDPTEPEANAAGAKPPAANTPAGDPLEGVGV